MMSDSQDLDKLLSKLTRDEKISLLAAAHWWRTQVIKRDDVFVPHIKVSFLRSIDTLPRWHDALQPKR